jgi:indole-3-glycerol phosphate synthase
MNILEQIKQQKTIEVAERKSLVTTKLLEKSTFFDSPTVSLKEYICDPLRSGIIAEFKRKSPSKGTINKYADVEKISIGYMQAGASALSILTDEPFFGAKKNDLETARKFNYCPILRKEFIIDEYQIIESKSMGADAILLIAKLLSIEQLKQFAELAKQLQLEVLIETESEKEIKDCLELSPSLLGINNRNLVDFKMNLDNSLHLGSLIPNGIVKIAESGIDSAQTIKELKQNGFNGFLIGEYFMRSSNPSEKCKQLIKELK